MNDSTDTGQLADSQGSYFIFDEASQKLDFLLHLLENSDRIALVKGQYNSGKSTFLEQLVAKAPNNWLPCMIEADPLFQPDQLFDQLSECFDVEIQPDMIENLIQRFEYLQLAGRLPVIIVDDAHQLPAASVIALFRLFERRGQSGPLVKIVIFATAEMEEYLRSPQVQAMNLQALQVMEMPRLNREEIGAFSVFLAISQPGLSGIKLRSAELDKLFRDSNGVIGEVKAGILAGSDKTPLPGNTQERESSVKASRAAPRASDSTGVSLWTYITGLLIALLLLMALVFQDRINALFKGGSKEAEETLELPAMESPVPLSIPVQGDEESTADELPAEAEPFVPGSDATRLEVSQPRIEANQEDTHVATEPAPQEQRIESTESEQDAVPGSSDAAAGRPVPAGEAVSAPPQTPRSTTPSGVAAVQQQTTPVADAGEIAETAVETPSQPTIKGAAKPATAPNSLNPLEKFERQLMAQRRENYTLQLISVGSAKDAGAYVTRHKISDQARYFKTVINGKAWFSVVYGSYPDRERALKARSTLPESLKNSKVWPRSLASVQAAISGRP